MVQNVFSQRINFFSELLRCGSGLYCWEYDAALQLVATNCPDVEIFADFWELGGCQEYLREYLQKGGQKLLVLSSQIGLNWIAAMETVNGIVTRIYMIGPALTSDISVQMLERMLAERGYSVEVSQLFQERLEKLPIMPLVSWLQFGKMLYFSVTGEEIEISDFEYQTNNQSEKLTDTDTPFINKGNTWLAEQEAMRMIEKGCIDYKKAFEHLNQYAAYAELGNDATHKRKARNSLISFITLSTRAAIRGGLDVQTAYFVGEQYIQSVESVSTVSEFMQITGVMFEDFVQRVHKLRQHDGISSPIQACCAYIELHAAETITLKQLASEAGYTEYYLTRKFKQETGMSVSQYIQEVRLRKAKELLRATTLPIQDIADKLGYSGSSRFIRLFRAGTGMTPGEYRNKTKHEKPN